MTIYRLLQVTVLAACLLAASFAAFVLLNRPTTASAASNPTTVSASPESASSAPVTPAATPDALPTAAPVDVIDAAPPALVAIPDDLIAEPTPAPGTNAGPLPVFRGIPEAPRNGDVVYLTFDDGPDPTYTNQVLDVLAHYDARATFFVLGSLVDAHPGVAQRMVDEGHALGNHTYFHEALPRESPDAIRETLSSTNAAIERATGTTTSCMRPPYGSLDQASFDIVSAQGFNVHLWDVDSEDWRTNDTYTIASQVLATTDLGDRVLFHDGPTNRAATVAALESVLDVLSARGVQFQALSC